MSDGSGEAAFPASGAAHVAPPCPITGEPPRRLIQWVSSGFLNALWRYTFRVDAARVTRGVARFGLWESRAGLVYFDPMLAGDGEFYRDFYRRIGAHEALSSPARPEYRMVAAATAPGAKLLDVGCGEGGLARHLPAIDYVGLDLHFGGSRPNLLAEGIEQHVDYETKVNLAIQNARIMAVCTYPARSAGLHRCKELIHNHGKLFVKRGPWVHDKSKDAKKIEAIFASLITL